MSPPSARAATKSPIALAVTAYRVARQALEPYSCRRSRHDFTQAQLFAILALRQFFTADYRGIAQILQEWSDLRAALDLKKVPHFTTLQKAEQRFQKKGSTLISSIESSSVLSNAAS